MHRVDTWTGLWGASIPGGMGAVAFQIFLQRVHFWPFYVCSIVPCSTTPPIWLMFQIFYVYFDHMHKWKVSGCWKYDMLAKMTCLYSGGKNKMDDWVVFWCTMLALEPKEKLFTILFKVVHYSNHQICEIKMIPIRITKWYAPATSQHQLA
ncbi:hypothetical protein FRACYDRAFT_251455 [Fragilariopsis cylindrus CCMP1102]|uniref:Uncharacterized protein n=1 Tax=Fragilariopsis cylindrus CCMP1102 TaxID=635003 RepID=A0A1E7EMN9_9STRA|nr:hypothetical protein FRACYDRAFT_251455 [Fragilariopsis cylindrus CCMP1102]|eukprot:OEU07171.1 hypothetical protein FRACYDRAFT_251455 [Fragilariopsis cylindrus CCMP1102]